MTEGEIGGKWGAWKSGFVREQRTLEEGSVGAWWEDRLASFGESGAA